MSQPIPDRTTLLPSGRRRLLRRILAGSACLFTVVVAFLLYIGMFWGNIRTVQPGRAFRSAQLSPAQLSELIREHRIRTVISLKGGNMRQGWYQRQNAVCVRDGATLRQIPMSASKLPPPEQLRELVRLFDESEYPILFHCKAGADRSGLAATLYLHLIEGKPLDQAEREGLTWRYGHFPFETVAMDQFFDLYRKTSQGTDLRSWIRKDYPSIYAKTQSDDRVASSPALRPTAAPGLTGRIKHETLVR